MDQSPPSSIAIETTMSAILATAFAILVGMHSLQLRSPQDESAAAQPPDDKRRGRSALLFASAPFQLPDPQAEPSKYCHEIFAWYYTCVWITVFGCVVVSQRYENFTAWGYLGVCGGLALPLLLQPVLYPQASSTFVNGIAIVNPDTHRPFHARYSSKANLYLITYSFIGNYWYTHYFYSVLKAKYTMPAHRLNDVPIAMFLATHFYFCTYHACVSNGILRYVDRSYIGGWRKQLLFWFTVLFLSYFTAFMETLTISSFPYYSFEDRTMAYVWGSAFYGIYFLVSFPGFYYFDSHIDDGVSTKNNPHSRNSSLTLTDTFITACGHGMLILTLLDFVRLYLGVPLVIGGVAFAATS
jgi:cycloeucalenol cycloisomerase